MRALARVVILVVAGVVIGRAALSHGQANRDRRPPVSQAAKSSLSAKTADQKIEQPSTTLVQTGAGDKASKRDRQEPVVVLTPAREAAALAFVRNHHPELVELIDRLKAMSPDEYEKAVIDLFRNSERLAAMQETDPSRYELALSAWKIKSRIQLLAARASLSDDDSIRLELRTALAEQAEVRLEQLRHERKLIAERLKKAEAALARFEKERDGHVEAQYNSLVRQIERAGDKAKALKRKVKRQGGKEKTKPVEQETDL